MPEDVLIFAQNSAIMAYLLVFELIGYVYSATIILPHIHSLNFQENYIKGPRARFFLNVGIGAAICAIFYCVININEVISRSPIILDSLSINLVRPILASLIIYIPLLIISINVYNKRLARQQENTNG